MRTCDWRKTGARVGVFYASLLAIGLAAAGLLLRPAAADEPSPATTTPEITPAAPPVGPVAEGKAAENKPAVDFEPQIAPLLIRNCLRCHNSSESSGELNLSDHAAALKAGDSGLPAIVPGHADKSYLLDRVRDGEMPPEGKGERLSAEDQATLSAWIEAGAAWPDGRVLSTFEFTTKERAGSDWWSLVPPRRPDVPTPAHADRVRTPIDAFVLARLEQAGLEPAAEADRATLIRRAMFDVWGLPPDPAEVDAFVADPDPQAYEHLVDRLLASPHYGERWAQHWLDVVRFAESSGFKTNTERANAWPYRDYVIRALNDDIPYPQFIREQLAGDQLGVPIATGFLVAGPYDGVSSPNEELTRQQRHQILDDIVSTIGQGFLATTVSCAKCHDHKFDVVSQHDYYALQSLVAGVRPAEREIKLDSTPEQQRQSAELRQQLAALEAQMRGLRAQAEPLARLDVPLADPAALRSSVQATGNVERFAPIAARWIRMTVLASNDNNEPCIDELEIFAADNGRNVALAGQGAVATASGVYHNGELPIHQLANINDGQYGNGRSWISNEMGVGWIQIELPESIVIDRIEWARDRSKVLADRLPLRYRIEVAEQPNGWQAVATGDDRRAFSPQDAPQTPAGLSEAAQAQLAQLRSQSDVLATRINAIAPATVFAGIFAAPDTIYRLHRGEVMQRREPIAPATPALVGTPVALAAEAPDAERRLALANWLGSETNPLVGRVMVNRIWQHHFGRGLVNSPNDFGFNGGRPAQAALLDWLTTEFVAAGWRPKHLHRLILLSSVYRQSSRSEPIAAAADGDNELLWRFSPQRLDAEEIHDAILTVSGVMDLAAGGPGYLVYEPNPIRYVKVYIPRVQGPAEWRRMIYQNKPRMRPEPTFGAFDCPDGSASMARRNVSTTALQSLNLLNSVFMTQQAQKFAERLERERPGNVDAQVERAVRLAFSRSVEADELAAARVLVAAHGLPQFCRALLNANEFVYVR